MLSAATLRFHQSPSRQPNASPLAHATETVRIALSFPYSNLPSPPCDQVRQKGNDAREPPLHRRGPCFLVLPIAVTQAGTCLSWGLSFFLYNPGDIIATLPNLRLLPVSN